MTSLVVFYSRTGSNKKLGETIAQSIDADIDEIVDQKSRKGIVGWIRAGRDALGKKTTEIQFDKNPNDYDIVIVGSPIWAGNLPPPVRTYLIANPFKGKKVAFYICAGGEGYSPVFDEMKELTSEAKHLAILGITQKQLKNNEYEIQLNAFIERLK